MIVFRSPSEARLLHRRHSEADNLDRRHNVSCTVSQVYPLPQLRMMIGNIPIRQDVTQLGG